MSKENKDKIADQTQPESSPTDDSMPVDSKLDSSEDTPKEPERVAQDTVNEMSGNSNDTQMVAETFKIENEIDRRIVEDTPDHQASMYSQLTETNEGAVDNEDVKGASEDRLTDEYQHPAGQPDQPNDNNEPVQPDRQDAKASKTDVPVEDRLSADVEFDRDSTAEGEVDDKNNAPEAETIPADEDPNISPESTHSDEDQNLDAESGDPSASQSTESANDDLSADKESDAPNENKDNELSKENTNRTDVKSDDSSKLDASISTSKDDEDEDLSAAKQSDVPDSDAENDPPAQNPDDILEETGDLPELEPKKKIPLAKAAMTIVIVVALFSGFIIFDNKSNVKPAQKTKSKVATKALSPQANQEKLKPAIQPDDPNYIYYAKIDEISALRDTLLHKKEEIMTLKKSYQSGIEELEKEILDELQHSDNVTFLEAIENKRIIFTLRTIQRRLAYIQELDRPARWLFQAAEDLLYIKRKALLDIQVAEVASGIDMNMHVRHMNTALNKYRPTADKLAIDVTHASSESLESIWQRVQNRNLAVTSHRAHSKNQIIFEQICSGNFSGLAELSEISVDSAKCIVEKQGSDLFLNGLTEISPSAARHLFQWKGDWICLNGFRALSPRVAAYLFEWEGRWISLNGLTDFPPEIGTLLLQWQGKQLELMGLRYTDDSAEKIGIKYLAEWERSGGKLFVPKPIRKKIDEINGEQRPYA